MSHQLENERDIYPLVYVIEEGVLGFLTQENAYWSRVRYFAGGFEYNVMLGNDEFLLLDENKSEEGD